MRGAPQSGLAILMSRMSSRVPCGVPGRPPCGRDPAPIGSETGAVPTDHRLRLEDFKRIEHLRSQTIEPGKYQAINVAESHSLGRSAMQHIELVSKEQDFSMQRSPRPEWCEDRRPHQPAKIAHQNEVSTDSQTIVSRFQFAVGTAARPARSSNSWVGPQLYLS